ncbi:MAG: hypothetical protein V8S89_07030 [Oscillospiraceae bacterium]
MLLCCLLPLLPRGLWLAVGCGAGIRCYGACGRHAGRAGVDGTEGLRLCLVFLSVAFLLAALEDWGMVPFSGLLAVANSAA